MKLEVIYLLNLHPQAYLCDQLIYCVFIKPLSLVS